MTKKISMPPPVCGRKDPGFKQWADGFIEYFEKITQEMNELSDAKPLEEWSEDIGPVLWWRFPIEEPPYCGTPLDSDWPGYHTHWSPFGVPYSD